MPSTPFTLLSLISAQITTIAMLLTQSAVILITGFGIPCLALGNSEVADTVVVRQSPIKPQPCRALSPSPTKQETKKRFHCFANAFLLSKNLTEAFSYIANDYIVRSKDFISSTLCMIVIECQIYSLTVGCVD
jgi:hypothetical protein